EMPEPEHLWPAPPPIEAAPPLNLPASLEIDPLPKPSLHIVPPPRVEEPIVLDEVDEEEFAEFEIDLPGSAPTEEPAPLPPVTAAGAASADAADPHAAARRQGAAARGERPGSHRAAA